MRSMLPGEGKLSVNDGLADSSGRLRSGVCSDGDGPEDQSQVRRVVDPRRGLPRMVPWAVASLGRKPT